VTAAAAPPRPWGRFEPGNILQILLVFVPLAILGEWLHWSRVAVFVLAGLAIIPLAGLLGESTEWLASRFGAGVGGLLNATFGNAAELIISIAALRAGLFDVVKASLTGSIIGNILLVLGLAIVAGGARRERQTFDRAAAAVGSTLLALAVVGLVVPALFHIAAERAGARGALEQGLSLEIAIVLFVVYLLSLLFSLRTHRHMYAGQSRATPAIGATPGRRGAALRPGLTLLLATALIAWMSELLVGAVGEATVALGLSPVFVGVIVVATVGNAAEHSTAVLVAMKNQMDLAFHIAIGSSIQIALFVAPLLVFLSRLMPAGPMDLRFTPFEVLAVVIAVGVLNLVAQDGESNWLEGVLLLAVYLILGLAFYFLP
jgi:Ca2+:H+ antiporter